MKEKRMLFEELLKKEEALSDLARQLEEEQHNHTELRKTLDVLVLKVVSYETQIESLRARTAEAV